MSFEASRRNRCTSLLFALAICAGFSAIFPSKGTAQVAGDECASAIVAQLGSNAVSTIGATNSLDFVDAAFCPFGGLGFVDSDIWLTFTPTTDGLLTASLCNSIDWDSDLVIYQGSCANLTQITCSGDAFGCLFTSRIENLAVTAGSTYFFRVGGWSAADTGSGTFDLTLNVPGVEVGNCADGIDNDSDGSIDCADSDCSGDPLCATPDPTFRRGDCVPSGNLNIADAIGLLQYLFAGATPPACEDACDFDDGGTLNIADAITLLGYLFSGGPPPAPPGPTDCGVDPTPGDPLTCTTSPNCP